MMIENKNVLLLDMNSTFMFGEDRFGDAEDFSQHYAEYCGELSAEQVNSIIRTVYDYMALRYPDEKYRYCFPSLATAIDQALPYKLDEKEITNIIHTFAFHELGHIPEEYATALHQLKQHFTLAAVIDIWSPKSYWLNVFKQAGIFDLFSALSFSSDHGVVKPAPEPFEQILVQLNRQPSEAIVIGDSARRDLGGAQNAKIDCILVGQQTHSDAYAHFDNIIEFSNMLTA